MVTFYWMMLENGKLYIRNARIWYAIEKNKGEYPGNVP